MSALGPYRAVLRARFRMLLQYRAAALAGLFTQIFFGFVLIMIYDAFYRSGTSRPIALPQLVTYVWLGQALLAMLPMGLDPEWRDAVRSGAIAYELCRPVDLYGMAYARVLARRTAAPLLRAVPMTIFAAFVLPAIGMPEFRLAPPPSVAAAASFAVVLAGALALACAISVLLDICVMWTLAGEGVYVLATTSVMMFSGLMIPLPLFPDWAQTALGWLPFAGVMDLPFRIYTAHIAAAALPLVLARQLGWTLVLVAFGRWLLSRAMRRIVVQGG